MSDCIKGSGGEERITVHDADVLHPAFNRNFERSTTLPSIRAVLASGG
jgi:hypothetical protein